MVEDIKRKTWNIELISRFKYALKISPLKKFLFWPTQEQYGL